jgi:hypothetical protein
MVTRARALCTVFTVAGFLLIAPNLRLQYFLNPWTVAGIVCLAVASVLACLIFHAELKNFPDTERSPK